MITRKKKTIKKYIKKSKNKQKFKIYRGGFSSDVSSSDKRHSSELSVGQRPVDVLVLSSKRSAAPAAPNASPKFEKNVVPVAGLEGEGRAAGLPFNKQIHSDGANLPESLVDIKEQNRDKFKMEESLSSSSIRRKKRYQRRVQQMKIPTPPLVELSPRGRGLATTYTPPFKSNTITINIRKYY
jgi:hypothetical protein